MIDSSLARCLSYFLLASVISLGVNTLDCSSLLFVEWANYWVLSRKNEDLCFSELSEHLFFFLFTIMFWRLSKSDKIVIPQYWKHNSSKLENSYVVLASLELEILVRPTVILYCIYCLWCFPYYFQLYDIRSMKELESFRGHRKDVTG